MITEPDWKGCEYKNGTVKIGNSIIKEYVIINKSTTSDSTAIGDGCYIMPFCFIGHDSIIGDNVQMCPGAKIAGFSQIGDGSVLGINCSVHQRSKLGRFCMLGAQSFFKGFSPDGIVWVGVPSVPIKINHIALEKSQLSKSEKNEIIRKATEFIDTFR